MFLLFCFKVDMRECAIHQLGPNLGGSLLTKEVLLESWFPVLTSLSTERQTSSS